MAKIFIWTLLAVIGIVLFMMLLQQYHTNYTLRKKVRKAEQRLTWEKKNVKNLTEKYERQSHAISLIQDHMSEGLIVLDDSDKIQMANKTATTLLKINPNDWDTKSIFILTENHEFLSSLRESKRPGREHVKKTLQLDEKYIRIHLHRIAIGGIYSTIILLVDVTYNMQAETMRQEFTANVSHELKTPLTTIKGFGEMFGSGMITDQDEIQKYGTTIERESERLLFLINDIMRLSEIETQPELLSTPVELTRTAQHAIDVLAPTIQARNMHVTLITPAAGVYLMRSNETYLHELFLNLIDNSVKYNDDGGSVWVNIFDTLHEVEIVVADNGIGIPPQAQSRIFERFYRVDKSRSKKSGGTGLGLSIVKHIVDCHGGEIQLESAPHRGTRITVTLPKYLPN